MHVQRGFASVNGTRLYHETAGAGHPLVFIHGFSLDARMWDDQFEAFARQGRVIRYDVRGFGQSALPTDEPYRNVDDLRALLDHLGIGRADIVGLSMGGGIAVDFALAYPEAVRALIPVDSTLGGFRWSEAWEASYRPVAAKGRAGDIAGAKALWMAHAFFAPALEKPDVAARFRQMVSDYSGWHWNHRDPGRGVEPPACERLSEIRAPTLIVIGERDLPDLHRTAEALARGLPHARKVTLPGVGHMANLEAPEAFNRAALDFLAGL